MKDAVVIGAGFAGLSAAVALSEAGVRVTVLEGKPALGGRAYSFADADAGDFVDNGQHVLMGCYGETLDFLRRIGAYDQLVFHEDLEIEMLAGPGQSAILKTARLPGPLHMTAALLGYRHLSIAERVGAMRGGLRMLAMRRFGGGELRRLTVAQLMDRIGQSEHARRCFWYPLLIATLNDEPQVSSAQLLAEVMKRAFFSRRRDSAFVYSRVGLSDLYCTGAKRTIERAGGQVVFAFDRGDAGDRRSRPCRRRAAARRAASRGVGLHQRSPGGSIAAASCRKTRSPIHFFRAWRVFRARRSSSSTHGSIAK